MNNLTQCGLVMPYAMASQNLVNTGPGAWQHQANSWTNID